MSNRCLRLCIFRSLILFLTPTIFFLFKILKDNKYTHKGWSQGENGSQREIHIINKEQQNDLWMAESLRTKCKVVHSAKVHRMSSKRYCKVTNFRPVLIFVLSYFWKSTKFNTVQFAWGPRISMSFCFEALESTTISSYERVSSQKYENGYWTKICDFTVALRGHPVGFGWMHHLAFGAEALSHSQVVLLSLV